MGEEINADILELKPEKELTPEEKETIRKGRTAPQVSTEAIDPSC